jgi:hypothetical protein
VAFEEKRAWIMIAVSVTSYAVYLVIILGRAGNLALAEVPYAATLLWTVGAAIATTIVLTAVAGATAPKEAGKKDERDREINRFGEYIGQSFGVIGGLAALIMSMLELDHFWIANAVYLTFMLSAVLGSVAKVFAYRRGFQSW